MKKYLINKEINEDKKKEFNKVDTKKDKIMENVYYLSNQYFLIDISYDNIDTFFYKIKIGYEKFEGEVKHNTAQILDFTDYNGNDRFKQMISYIQFFPYKIIVNYDFNIGLGTLFQILYKVIFSYK